MFKPEDLKVAVIAGGTSGERDISLASGKGAAEALMQAGFSIEMIDPAEKDDLKKLAGGSFDVAFLCLHGKQGEDGTMQGFLEIVGIPYTGSGVLSSAVSMDKTKAKLFYLAAGLPTPQSLTTTSATEFTGEEIAEKVGLPCVVKPASEGSALGVYIVKNACDCEEAIVNVLKHDNKVIIEKYISGTEVTVAVIGNENPEALPIIEIVPVNDFYDFESKYAEGGSRHICPAPLEENLTAKIMDLAVKAHEVLECRGMSRTDFIIDEQGEPWILETNTIPGMTGTSLLPDAARAAGIEFPELCTKLIEFALE